MAKVVIKKHSSTLQKRSLQLPARGGNRVEVVLAIAAFALLLLVAQQLRLLFRHSRLHERGEDARSYFRAGHHNHRRSAAAHIVEEQDDDEVVHPRILEAPHRLPDDFVWHTYLRLHPDILKSGINNEKAAVAHFLHHGRKEGRAYRLPKLSMQYTACRSFAEQVYSHISAMVIASKLGPAALVWPSVLVDDPRGPHGYGTADAATVWDVDTMQRHWARDAAQAMPITKSTSRAMPMALTEPQQRLDWDTAWPAAREPPLKDGQVVQGGALFESLRTARRVTDALMAKVGKLQTDSGAGFDDEYEALVRLPCLFWAIRTDSAYQTISEKVVPSLAFNAHVQQLAQRAVDSLGRFDALVVHNDSDVAALTGRNTKALQLYVSLLKPRFTSGSCFVALEHASLEDHDLDTMADVLREQGVCQDLVTQDDVVRGRQLDRLNSEQLALLDMLIVMQAQVVGGSYWSLTTLLVRELRYMREGVQRSTVLRVNVTDEHLYTAEQLFYGGLLDEPAQEDKLHVRDLPFATTRPI